MSNADECDKYKCAAWIVTNLKSDNFAKRGDENDNNVISQDYFAENEEDDEDSEYNIFEILIAEDYFWTMTTAIMKTGRKGFSIY